MATTSFSIATSPSNGVLSAFNATTGQVTYTPNNNYTGADSFTYNILCDGVIVDTAAVNITVQPQTGVQTITNSAGGAPVLDPKCGQAIDYRSTTVFTPSSPAVSPITYSWSTNNVGAVVTNGTTALATVTFAPGLIGNVDITVVQVTPFETLTTTITVNVKCADAVLDTVSTFANTAVVISLSTNDVVCN
jgi:large repetitive protein